MQRFGVAARLLVGFHDAVDCTVHANQSRRIGRDDLGRVANNVLIWSALALIRNQWVGITNPSRLTASGRGASKRARIAQRRSE